MTVERAVVNDDVIAIDTGAGNEGGALSAVLLPERTIVRVA